MFYILIKVIHRVGGKMKKQKQAISIIIVFIIIASASYMIFQYQSDLNIDEEPVPGDNGTLEPLGNLTFRNAINAFTFNFFKELSNDNTENIFISPYSIFTALAMTYEGAEGDTADEMASVLSVEQDNASFHEYMKNLYELLNEQNEDYNISTANALWIKKNFQLLETYLSVIRDFYGGEATEVDFSNPEESAEIINNWVENHTNNLIQDLITPDVIDPLTALILTNAIYFKGVWRVQFDPINTTDRDFETNTEDTIQVPTMKLVDTEDVFYYTETDDLQILELPYTGDDLSMMILLPKNNDLSDIIDTIDDDSFLEWKESMIERNVDIYLPKYKVETKYSLKPHLQQLGMNNPFTPIADFSGITGRKDLYISSVVHKAYIDVNEEGTEAAAATGVVMVLTSNGGGGSSRITFDCDHPFLYLIQHTQTGTILFMGKVVDPQ